MSVCDKNAEALKFEGETFESSGNQHYVRNVVATSRASSSSSCDSVDRKRRLLPMS